MAEGALLVRVLRVQRFQVVEVARLNRKPRSAQRTLIFEFSSGRDHLVGRFSAFGGVIVGVCAVHAEDDYLLIVVVVHLLPLLGIATCDSLID